MRDVVPFLDPEPPPRVVRALADLIVVAFALALALSILIRLPVTVSGRFALVPVRGADPLRAPRAGIVSVVAAGEGALVEKGAPLFRLRSELAGDRAGEVAQLTIALRGTELRRENERARAASQAEADRDELEGLRRRSASLGREIALAERKAELAGKVVAHARTAHREGLVAYDEVQAKELTAAQAELELVRLRSEREQAAVSAERLGHEMQGKERALAEAMRALAEEADRARVRLATLRAAPAVGEGNELRLDAPCAGTVVRLHARAPGAVVAEGETLAELVCAGEELRAEISVADRGMGLVTPGQRAKLFYDAFPYQRHGVRYATVRWIGPAPVARPESPAFRAHADLADRDLRAGGACRELRPGMTGDAEIIVAEQSALAYVLEPLRAVRENLATAPAAPP